MRKLKIPLLFLLCVSPHFANARLGDTPDQLSKRLGVEGETTTDTIVALSETKLFLYKKGEFYLIAYFWKGKCCREVYRKRDRSEISDIEIDGLLKANNFGSDGWVSDATIGISIRGIKHWQWGDKVGTDGQHKSILEATYDIGSKFLSFQTTTFGEAYATAEKAKEGNGVRGF